jgi:branched-chain amino acid transport system substrate-binding protein
MKSKFWYRALAWLVIIGFFTTAPGFWKANATDKSPYKIGFTDGLSGSYAHYGMDTRAGIETAVDEINQKGGILGRRVNLYTRDDKLNPEIGLSNAKDLVFGEKVDFLVGVTSSGVALAVSGFAKEQKVPFIVTIAQSEHITGKHGHRYIFRMTTNTHLYSYADSIAAAKLNLKNWWILAPDYEYGHACYDSFKKMLKERQPDVQFVGEGWPKLGNPDYTPYVTPIVASKAQGLFNVISGGDFVRLIKTGQRMGLLRKVAILGHDLGCLNTYYSLGKKMPEGIWGGTQYPFWDHAANPRSESLYKKINHKLGRPPGLGAPCGYEAVWAIARAAKKAGSTDREKIIDALEGMTFDTVVGPVTLRDFDHQATWPFVFGRTKFVPEYPNFPILVDTFKVKDEAYPTKEAILKARSGK